MGFGPLLDRIRYPIPRFGSFRSLQRGIRADSRDRLNRTICQGRMRFTEAAASL